MKLLEISTNKFKKGILKEEVAKEYAKKVLLSQNIGLTGYFYCLNSSGIIKVHPQTDMIGKDVSELGFIQEQLKNKTGYLEYMWKNKPKVLSMTYFKEWDWIISASAWQKELTGTIKLEVLKNEISKIKIGKKGYIFIVDSKGLIISHPKISVGKDVSKVKSSNGKYFMKEVLKKKNGYIHYDWKNPGEKEAKEKFVYFKYHDKLNWIIITSSYTDEYAKGKNEILFFIIVSLGVLFFIIIPMFIALASSVVNPIKKLIIKMKDISEGKGGLTQKIQVKTSDETRILANHFNDFIENMKNIVLNIKKHVQVLKGSSDDLVANAQQSASSIHEIAASINSVVGNVNQEKNMLEDSNTQVKDIMQSVTEVFEMTHSMKNQLSQSSSAIEEMAANISSTADMAHRADNSTESLTVASSEGNAAMDVLSKSIQEVSENSEQIVEMVQLIMDISEQTNLLAMNAAIEAAHAGEYGKGFAVVAEEIRKLADKSSQGAKEIQEVVKVIANSIQQNLKQADKTRNNFEVLQRNIGQVKQVTKEISAAMSEQKSANQSVLGAVNELNSLGSQIAEKSQSEKIKGESVLSSFLNLNVISQEIVAAMEEKKKALEEASDSAEHINRISLEINQVSDEINSDFDQFKVE